MAECARVPLVRFSKICNCFNRIWSKLYRKWENQWRFGQKHDTWGSFKTKCPCEMFFEERSLSYSMSFPCPWSPTEPIRSFFFWSSPWNRSPELNGSLAHPIVSYSSAAPEFDTTWNWRLPFRIVRPPKRELGSRISSVKWWMCWICSMFTNGHCWIMVPCKDHVLIQRGFRDSIQFHPTWSMNSIIPAEKNQAKHGCFHVYLTSKSWASLQHCVVQVQEVPKLHASLNQT